MSNYIKHAEAACCIWEALLERAHNKRISDDKAKAIAYCFEQRGTNEMRHAAISLSVLCSDLWHALPEDERPHCFDWDYVPAFVDMLAWDANTSSLVAIPSVAEALEMYRAYWKAAYGIEPEGGAKK
jgi:hypothetical protein